MDETSGNRNDSHTNTLHLSPTNTPSSITGKIGNAVTFLAASSQDVRRATESLIQPNASGFSLCMWMYASSGGSGIIFSKDTNANPNRQMLLQFAGTDPSFFVWDTTNALVSINWNQVVTLGTFAFLACRYNGTTRKASISINAGTPRVSAALGASLNVSGTAALVFGRRNAGDPANSTVDEAGYWSRELTDAEVTELYNGGTGKTYPFS